MVRHQKSQNFRQKVIKVVAGIPRGSVMTYQQVAKLAGSPRAFRAVGNILNKNRDPMIPCHRVIRSDGQIGGYAWGKERKKAILEQEGFLSTPGTVLTKDFFIRPVLSVAPSLLGKYLVRRIGAKTIAFKITEVEAYDGPLDKACHASKGLTPRTAPMFESGGIFYVYLCYGMHWMLNIVTGPKNYPAAILIRAAEDDSGEVISVINGPAKLTKALRIDKSLNAKPATPASGLWFEDRGIRFKNGQSLCLDQARFHHDCDITKCFCWERKFKIIRSPRVGVDYAGPIWSKKPYRFTLTKVK